MLSVIAGNLHPQPATCCSAARCNTALLIALPWPLTLVHNTSHACHQWSRDSAGEDGVHLIGYSLLHSYSRADQQISRADISMRCPSGQ